MNEIHSLFIYFSLLLLIALASSRKRGDLSDFFVGNRSMNFWLTAFSAHASDMSSWLFLAFPATIFTFGLFKAWVAVGLLLFMYLNWQWIAPRLRAATEEHRSLTFFSYLEARFRDHSLTLYCTSICFFFYVVYIASGLLAMGLLIESIYGLPYEASLLATVGVVLLSVLLGGYRTLAWIDLFQGCFLLGVLIFVPLFLLHHQGGAIALLEGSSPDLLNTFFPNRGPLTYVQIGVMVFGWGLGYFGQPAILTKFMGIERVEEIRRSQYVGMIWMLLSLSAASLVGVVGQLLFKEGIENPEMLFVEMVKGSFAPFWAGLILCAVFAATINVMSSQLLVIGSSFFQDVYLPLFKKRGTSSPLLITQAAICTACTVATLIAYFKVSSVYSLVLYAWSGLGSAFGPILLFSLYTKQRGRLPRQIGWGGVLTGSLSSALWPCVEARLHTGIDPMVIGFTLSFAAIGVVKWRLRALSEPRVTHNL